MSKTKQSAMDRWDTPPEEKLFWDRLQGMPWIEAEQECVLRREQMMLEMNMLQSEAKWCRGRGNKTEAERIGDELLGMGRTIGVINERIKYFRKARDSASWAKAVTALYGQEGFEECRAWMAQFEVTYDGKDH